MSNIGINKKYQDVLRTNKRYILITGGRNSSKSYTISTLFTYKSINEYQKILYTRYTLTSADVSIIPEFKEKIDLLNANSFVRITENSIKFKNTSEIIFKGIKSSSGNLTANLKSLHGITTWIYDEFEEQKNESEFDKIDFSIRNKKTDNKIIMIMNPGTIDHWVYKRYFENTKKYINIDGCNIPISTHPDVLHIHTTYLDNINNIPDDYLKRIKDLKETNVSKYNHIFLGQWIEQQEGAIFTNWSYGEFDNSLQFGYGLDFGVKDPDALVKVAIDRQLKKIYIDEIFYKSGNKTSELYQLISNYVAKNSLIIADSSGLRQISDLKHLGFNISGVNKKAYTIIESIRLMQDYEIIITYNSNNLAKELQSYLWLDKKGEIPIDDQNHLIDATRYYIMTCIKQHKQFKGHKTL